MKKIILLNALIVIASFSFAQTQGELNDDAKNKYEIADKKLNQVYINILNENKTDSIFIKNLRKSQKLWVQFRDSELKVKYPEREPGYYGSVKSMCWYLYKEELTRQRTSSLKKYLEEKKEGDVCN